jgi:S1-C subfamily serine protease
MSIVEQQQNIDVGKVRAEKATVRILRRNSKRIFEPLAQGVLVPGGYILTAAHCIDWDGEGQMALGDWYIETIQSSDGTQYKVSPCAVEPMTDIAVLVAVDGQEMFEEHYAFEEYCEATEPVPVSEDDFPLVDSDGPPVRVHTLTHKGMWISGSARRLNAPPFGNVWVNFDAQIEGGTSGGPVIDDNGLLVGVISHSSENSGACDGQMPRPHLALPAWVWNRVKLASAEGD